MIFTTQERLNFLFLAVKTALCLGMSVWLSVNNEFKEVRNASKVHLMIMFQCILVHSMNSVNYACIEQNINMVK